MPAQKVPQGLPVRTARPGPLDPPVPQGLPVQTALMANEEPWAEPAHRAPLVLTALMVPTALTVTTVHVAHAVPQVPTALMVPTALTVPMALTLSILQPTWNQRQRMRMALPPSLVPASAQARRYRS